MYEPNVQRVLDRLGRDDVVLDIGGWASTFNRANWVMDAMPYATRGFYRTFGGKPYQAGEQELFAK
jgi:SAM-dependent methyltransferase